MLKFRAMSIKSMWTHRFRCAVVVGMTSISLIAGSTGSIRAELFPRPKIPKPVDSVEPQSNSAFDNAIRNLLKEAKYAESKGEFDRALILAERAAKISEASTNLVKAAQDVSPEVTAAYAKELRSKRMELLVKQQAAEAALSPTVTAIRVPQKMRKPAEKPVKSHQSDDLPPLPTRNAPVAASKTPAHRNSTTVPLRDHAPAATAAIPRRNSDDDSMIMKSKSRAFETADFPEENSTSPEFVSNSRTAPDLIPAGENTPSVVASNSDRPSTGVASNIGKNRSQVKSTAVAPQSSTSSNSRDDNSTAMDEPPDSFEIPAPSETIDKPQNQGAADLRNLASKDVIDEANVHLQPVNTAEINNPSLPKQSSELAHSHAAPVRKDLRASIRSHQSEPNQGLNEPRNSRANEITTDIESTDSAPVSRIRRLRTQFIPKLPQQDVPPVSITSENPGESEAGPANRTDANEDAPTRPAETSMPPVSIRAPQSSRSTDDLVEAEKLPMEAAETTETTVATVGQDLSAATDVETETKHDGKNQQVESNDSHDLIHETESSEPAETQKPQVPTSIKLRPAFRDIQVTTSFASDTDTQAPLEDQIEEIELIASTDLSDEQETQTKKETTQPPFAKSFKLRPSFRDPRFDSIRRSETATSDENTILDSTSTNPPTLVVRKPVIGRTSMIHWRSANPRKAADSETTQTDESNATVAESHAPQTDRENANKTRDGLGPDAAGKGRSRTSSLSKSSPPAQKSSKSSVQQAAASDIAAARESHATAARDLRGSLWDNAAAPSVGDVSERPPAPSNSLKSAPLPPPNDGVQQTSFSVSNHPDHRDPEPKSNSASKSSSDRSSPASMARNNNLPQTPQKKRSRSNEDDHAASTRAILSSGPIQQLANFAGVPKSTAAAMLCVIGVALLIAGLWMIRATLGIQRN